MNIYRRLWGKFHVGLRLCGLAMEVGTGKINSTVGEVVLLPVHLIKWLFLRSPFSIQTHWSRIGSIYCLQILYLGVRRLQLNEIALICKVHKQSEVLAGFEKRCQALLPSPLAGPCGRSAGAGTPSTLGCKLLRTLPGRPSRSSLGACRSLAGLGAAEEPRGEERG